MGREDNFLSVGLEENERTVQLVIVGPSSGALRHGLQFHCFFTGSQRRAHNYSVLERAAQARSQAAALPPVRGRPCRLGAHAVHGRRQRQRAAARLLYAIRAECGI